MDKIDSGTTASSCSYETPIWTLSSHGLPGRLFQCGMNLLLISIVIEYMSIILLHTQGKPTFFVVDRSTDKLLLDYFAGQKDADPA